MRVVDTHPLTDKLPNSLELEIKTAAEGQRVGVANEGYWGIPLKPKTTYRASFYVKGSKPLRNRRTGNAEGTEFTGPLQVSLESNDGSKIYARAETPAVNSRWQRFEIPSSVSIFRNSQRGGTRNNW